VRWFVTPNVAPRFVIPNIAPRFVIPNVATRFVIPNVATRFVIPNVATRFVIPNVAKRRRDLLAMRLVAGHCAGLKGPSAVLRTAFGMTSSFVRLAPRASRLGIEPIRQLQEDRIVRMRPEQIAIVTLELEGARVEVTLEPPLL